MALAINRKNIKHPNTFSISRGTTLLSDEITSINQSIGLILSTSKGELFGDPTFGSSLKEMLFDYIGTGAEQEIRQMIVEELTKQEPRIILDTTMVSVETEGTTVSIKIIYELKYTDISSEYTYITQIQEGD